VIRHDYLMLEIKEGCPKAAVATAMLAAPRRGCVGVLMAGSCRRDSGSLLSRALLPVSLKPCVTARKVGIFRRKNPN